MVVKRNEELSKKKQRELLTHAFRLLQLEAAKGAQLSRDGDFEGLTSHVEQVTAFAMEIQCAVLNHVAASALLDRMRQQERAKPLSVGRRRAPL